MNQANDDNQIEQLLDLFVYAPVGLLYEYQDVLPQLVKRGRSQVQLARVMATMAARQNSGGSDQPTPEAALAAMAGVATRMFSDLLASALDADQGKPAKPEASSEPVEAETVGQEAPGPVPIAGYDELTAREIVALLPDLSPAQRSRVEQHERAHRARKTVLGKIERLSA